MATENSSEKALEHYTKLLRDQKPTHEQESTMMQNLLSKIDNYETDSQTYTNTEQQKLTSRSWLAFISSWFNALLPKQLVVAGSFAFAIAVSIVVIFPLGGNQAFANVVEQLKQINSMYYSGIMKQGESPIMELEVYYKAPNQLRIVNKPITANRPTTEDDGKEFEVINVMDLEQGKGLIIFPHVEQVVPFDFEPNNTISTKDNQDEIFNWIETVTNYKGEVKELPAELIDGIVVTPYLINESNIEITLWVDVKLQLPIRLKVEILSGTEESDLNNNFVFAAKIEFNEYIEPALFDIDPNSY